MSDTVLQSKTEAGFPLPSRQAEQARGLWQRSMRKLIESSVLLPPRNSVRDQILLAVAAVGVATGIRYSLGVAFGITTIFLLYHPAVLIAAWFGRFKCGVLATTLSVLAAKYFWIEPMVSPVTSAMIGNLGLFCIIGVFQSFLIELFQRAVAGQRDSNTKLTEANGQLAEARADLEKRVAERTKELGQVNERLKVEIAERQQAEQQERFYSQRSKALSVRLVELQEAEHRRIARELHDEIGQNLTGLKVVLDLLGRQTSPEVSGKLEEAQSLAQELLNRVRQMSLDLRPLMLDDLGLLVALRWFFERFTRQTETPVNFKHSPFADRLPSQLETALYRITQETLANIARHAAAKEVVVRLWRDAEVVRLQIEDNGVGFDVEKALASKASSGLSGMQERAALAGGELSFESSPGSGTRVTVEIPLAVGAVVAQG